MNSRRIEFDARATECIDHGLASMGDIAKRVVYSYLARNSNVERGRLHENPAAFIQALRTLFGMGAEMMEKSMVRELKKSFAIDSPKENLADILALAWRKFSLPTLPDAHLRELDDHWIGENGKTRTGKTGEEGPNRGLVST